MKHFVSAALSFLVWLSPITWLSIVFRHLRAIRQRQTMVQNETLSVPSPIALDANEFTFHNGSSVIRSILRGTVADGSLDEQTCEKLDLQLVWAEHHNQEHQNFAQRAVAELMLAWLWLRCSDAMAGNSFYSGKARGVCRDHVAKAERIASIGGVATAHAIEDFARRTSGLPISAEAWNVLVRANHDIARIAGGFHVCLGNERRTLLRIGGLTLRASTPVWFNGPQSDRERSEQAHYERLAGVAYSHARQERTRQATSA